MARTVVARWLVQEGLEGSWLAVLGLDGTIDDVRGAIAEAADGGDLETVHECISSALGAVAIVDGVFDGWRSWVSEAETFAFQLASDDPRLARYGRMATSSNRTLDTLADELSTLEEIAASVRLRLPFNLPRLRSGEEFFSVIRLAREISDLRTEIGLDPIELPGLAV